MPLDLVGKLHRTVYITDCPEDSQEDLMHMLLKRCGAVEAWDAADGRVTVVFRSMNSVSNALTFNGLSFIDLTRKLCVWRATDPPPAEATQQLAIQGGAPSASDGADAAPRDAAAEQAEEDRRLRRKERRAALQHLLQADAHACDTSSPEGRRAKLNELCRRQLKALCTLTAAALTDARAELEEKRSNLDRLRDLIRMKETEASMSDEPPVSKSRLERY
ncbi:hypothetical protein ABB37_09379 [Leptomonas pyrrhocoris]|uniref:RRM domain-containing protein n=1 Tax=Leptomonas pyrrhocoris TaxID=157538 RepID=A0A0M9FQL5_LEPPY|nr:hypothetical protein ABB37_09379 [Leptomonas pyrrhocoris]KPA74080.1 hypothetical protein ABB37_09379 [Leptomonas pyrrhocoris]|eukprot:XP_015652519.1 hypothetical protein ABB37_09379 [Leptomonas pyrrhocoris]